MDVVTSNTNHLIAGQNVTTIYGMKGMGPSWDRDPSNRKKKICGSQQT